MSITKWTDEGMDWSSPDTIKPWRKEHIEAIRVCLREKCLKAKRLDDVYVPEKDDVAGHYVSRWAAGPAWDAMGDISTAFDVSGRLAFARCAKSIETALKAVCVYFSDPKTMQLPRSGLPHVSNLGAWHDDATARDVWQHLAGDGWLFNDESLDGTVQLTYDAPVPGKFNCYTWQSLRREVALAGVELVGEISEGLLMDGAYARKWMYQVKSMLDLLIYEPWRQRKRIPLVLDYLLTLHGDIVDTHQSGGYAVAGDKPPVSNPPPTPTGKNGYVYKLSPSRDEIAVDAPLPWPLPWTLDSLMAIEPIASTEGETGIFKMREFVAGYGFGIFLCATSRTRSASCSVVEKMQYPIGHVGGLEAYGYRMAGGGD